MCGASHRQFIEEHNSWPALTLFGFLRPLESRIEDEEGSISDNLVGDDGDGKDDNNVEAAQCAQCLEVFEKYFLFLCPRHDFKCRKMISAIHLS